MNLPITDNTNPKCERCSGQHATEGCPGPSEVIEDESVLYWPPNPEPESWLTDVPNEGVSWDCWEFETVSLTSYKADYHGYFLLSPDSDEQKYELPEVGLYGEIDAVYLEAYQALEKIVSNPTLEEFCRVMDGLGWKQVVADSEETDGKYFKWKDSQGERSQ